MAGSAPAVRGPAGSHGRQEDHDAGWADQPWATPEQPADLRRFCGADPAAYLHGHSERPRRFYAGAARAGLATALW